MGEVKFNKPISFGDQSWSSGDIAEIDDDLEEKILEEDEEAIEQIEQLEEEPKLEIESEPAKGKSEGESGKGVVVNEFAETESRFLTADMVSEGDVIEILGSGKIDTSWDNERLVVPVEYQGEKYSLSMGKRNAKRISDGFGDDTSNWIGNEIRVVSIEEYPQLGSKGMILKPAEYVDEE